LLGLLIGAPIAEATSFTFVITMSAIIGACALPVAFLMHEPRHTLDSEHEAYFQTLFHGVRETWNAPALRYIVIYSGVLSAAIFGPLVFQQPFLADHGIGLGNTGWWQAPVRGVGIASALGVGWMLTRFGERTAFFALPVVLAISGLSLAGIDNAWVAVMFLGIGFCGGLQNPVLASYINHRIPSQRRATMLSVQNVVANIMFAAVQPVAGMIADEFGLQAVFLMYAIMTIVFGLGVLLLWDKAEREDAASGQGGGMRERPVEVVPAS
jgi:MFS family permease